MLIPMEVVGVRIEMPSNQPIVLLKEIDGSRFLPIWVGSVEASAIAFAQQGMSPPRPMTHDLIGNMLDLLDTTLTAIHLTELVDGIFYATLNLRDASSTLLTLSARPSDAIAVALRTKSNILADSDLLDQVGIDIPERLVGLDLEDTTGNSPDGAGSDSDLDAFREFLDQINPEDFAG